MAEPQEDQYDTTMTLRLASQTGSPQRPEPYVRRLVAGCPTICDGAVAIRCLEQTEMAPPRYPPAAPDHPNLALAAAHLRRWPAAYAQFKGLVDTVHPCLDAEIQPKYRDISVGSSSYSHERWFGTICVTVDHPLGCAQAFVHEMAHQKLRALGVSETAAWRLITNSPAERYPSPLQIRHLVPMTALLHDLYTFLHVTALDICLLRTEPDQENHRLLLDLLMRNAIRVEHGLHTLQSHVRTDAAGARFIDGLMQWGTRSLQAGREILRRHGYDLED